MNDLARQMVEHFEGCRLSAYLDTKGIPTIGYGHTEGVQMGDTCTQQQADEWLDTDMGSARLIAPRYPYYYQLNDVRRAVLVSMSFQLGSKPLHWPHFMNAMENRDYADAETQGLDSDWARTDSPQRAIIELRMLKTGIWNLSIN